MADRYWVGGAGNWSDTAHWSTTSGGSAGASVPTASDNAFFNASSGTGNAVINVSSSCLSLNCTGYSGSLTLTTNTVSLSVYGSFILSSTMTFNTPTYGGGQVSLNFSATSSDNTINLAGKSLQVYCTVYFNGSGSWTYANHFGSAGDKYFNSGTINLNGYNCSARRWFTGTSTISCGSGTISFDQLNIAASTTINTQTSTFVGPSYQGEVTCPNVTFYNINLGGGSNYTKVYNNLNVTNNLVCGSNYDLGTFVFYGNVTVGGTFSTVGSNPKRVFIVPSDFNTKITFSAGSVSLSYVDFFNVNAVGSAVPWSGTSVGDVGGNTNITFTTPKTVYWNAASGNVINANGWAATSGGAVDFANYPLPQDTAVFNNTNPPASTALSWDIGGGRTAWRGPKLDFSARTNNMSLNKTTHVSTIFTGLKGSSSVSLGGGGTLYFGGNSCDISINSSSVANPIYITKYCTASSTATPFAVGSVAVTNYGSFTSGTVLTCTTFTNYNTLVLNNGTFNAALVNNSPGVVDINQATTILTSLTSTGTLNLNNFSLTTPIVSLGANSVTNFGTANLTVTGTGTTIFTSNATATATGTALVRCTNGGSGTTRTINSSSPQFNISVTTGTDTVAVSGANNLDFTGFSGTLTNAARTIYGNLTLSSNITLTAGTAATTFAGTSGTQIITTNSKILDFPLIFNGVGGTFQLAGSLTQGSTRLTTLTNGTLDLNSKLFSVGTFTTGAGTKNITFNSGILDVTGSGSTAFNNSNPTGFTTTGSGIIRMSGSTAKTFVGGGSTYNCMLENYSTSALTISGSNTFTTLINSFLPATWTFTSGTTTTLTNWVISGISGSPVTINATSTSQATLSKASGTVSVNYCTISYSNATGGALWQAYTSNGNVNGGNNSGWIFSSATNNNSILFGSNF